MMMRKLLPYLTPNSWTHRLWTLIKRNYAHSSSLTLLPNSMSVQATLTCGASRFRTPDQLSGQSTRDSDALQDPTWTRRTSLESSNRTKSFQLFSQWKHLKSKINTQKCGASLSRIQQTNQLSASDRKFATRWLWINNLLQRKILSHSIPRRK